MGLAQRKIEESDEDSLAAAMRRLEAMAAEMAEDDIVTDGPSPTIEDALRLLGIDLTE